MVEGGWLNGHLNMVSKLIKLYANWKVVRLNKLIG